jgi:hypothetical protein
LVGQSIFEFITKPFVAQDFTILLEDKSKRDAFFAAIEELENAFLSIKTREY